MEEKDAHTAEQEKVTRERTRRRGSQEPTRQRKAWTLREYGGKPVWDWMDLLIVPVVLALITVAFTVVQESRQSWIEKQRAASALKAEEQRAQDVALQAYLDQMSTLLLKSNLRNSEEGSEVRTLARARTATVIQRLDSDGNENVIRFLIEAGLTEGSQSLPGLLAGVDLRGAHLEGVNLIGTDLSDADLSGALLEKADLSRASLEKADLSGAFMSEADLRGAKLSEAYLGDANLSGAVLIGAGLSGANLVEALGITKEELETQTENLQGATMPDGSIHDCLHSPARV